MAAEMVGGAILSAFLQVLFDRMASREVVDYMRGNKLNDRLLKKLKITLLSVNAVINDAEEKQFRSPLVKEWLHELKDAVYDAEDLWDEVATQALQCRLEAKSGSTISQVRCLDNGFIAFYSMKLNFEIGDHLSCYHVVKRFVYGLCLFKLHF
jgi:hypothetical protein